MAIIKNMGTATMRFKEGIIVSGSAGTDVHALSVTGSVRTSDNIIVDGKIGIGTDNPGYKLEVGGSMAIGEHIYHRNDTDTMFSFSDNQIQLKAGNLSFIKLEKKSSAPHEITLNNGSNNIDFIVKGNGSNEGNPGMKFDASNNRLGINGVGAPSYELDVDGNIGLSEYIYHRNDTDTFIRFEANKVSIDAGASSGDVILSGSVHAPNGITGSITKAASDLDGNRLAGGIYQLDDGLIQNPNSGYSRIFFPADDTLVETVGAVSTNYKIAPFNGELIKMQVKSIQDFTGKALTASLHVGTGTTNAYSSTAAVSVALNGQAAHSVYTFDFLGRGGNTFNEGNIFGFSLQLSENWAGNETIHFTSVVRFNPYP